MAAKRNARSKANQEFVSEAEEILDRMRDDLSELAEVVDRGGESDPETVNRLFRSAHSLKGLSGMFGLTAMSELAHHLEDVLDRLRMGRTALGTDGLAIFDDAVGTITTALEKVGGEGEDAATAEAMAELVGRIEGWTSAPAEEPDDLAGLDLPDTLMRALTEYEEHRLRENVNRGRGIFVIDVDFEIANFEEGLAQTSSAIREAGEVLSTLPSPGDAPDSHIRFSLLTAADLGAEALAERLEVDPEAVRTARAPAAAASPADATADLDTADEALVPADAGEAVDAPDGPTLKSISDTVRVDIKKLDELMNLVGELALQRAAIKSVATRLSSEATTARLGTELDKLHRGLERKLQELQSGVLDVRMVPLRQVFDKLSRVVRRLRVDQRKEVRLQIRGADTELDKLIVEELVDPLMHVVRNAFDHAIESSEERAALGKPSEGVIQIDASQRGNDVVISVRDDGRGIDADIVRARAIERGLIASDAELSRKETLELIFAPGLSTRSEVTETSGRGVGMDVVRSNISALGGLVGIDSTPAVGTEIQFTLPITLAIIQALIVGVGSHRFAVPLNSVRETLLVDPDEIQRSEGRELLNLRGEPLALRRLNEEFDVDGQGRDAKQFAVVLGMGDARLGLLVDRLEGQQDTVIKPIQGPVRKVRGIAGATELGDQGAVLVIDVSALVEDVVRGSNGELR